MNNYPLHKREDCIIVPKLMSRSLKENTHAVKSQWPQIVNVICSLTAHTCTFTFIH